MEEAYQVFNEAFIALEKEREAVSRQPENDFLAENSNKPGVIVTESGLQYEVLVEGSGEKPTADSMVRAHYEGTLIDGTVFDSSYSEGEPIEFPLYGVISGWTEALQLMNVGSKYRLVIPSDLGYGPQGRGAKIPPYSTLIFDVELLDIIQ
jgi:FKBP-type peptidyl-prolyl cis-trans isomerase FklB